MQFLLFERMRCFIPLILIFPPHLVNFHRVMRGSGPGLVSDPQSPLWPIGNPLWLASAHHPLTSSSSPSLSLSSILTLSSIMVVNIIIFHHHQMWSSLWLGCLQRNQICMLTMVVIWCVMMDKVAEVDPFPTRYERVSPLGFRPQNISCVQQRSRWSFPEEDTPRSKEIC